LVALINRFVHLHSTSFSKSTDCLSTSRKGLKLNRLNL
jgi:hypothetical protein